MSNISPSDPFTAEERRFLQNLEREFRMELDHDEIAKHLLDYTLNDYRTGGLTEIIELPPTRRAAAYLAFMRKIERDFDQVNTNLDSDHLFDLVNHLVAVQRGKKIIDDLGTWWTHEPTFEILFELGEDELRIMRSVMQEFFASDHFLAFMQYRMRFLSEFEDWTMDNLQTGNIRCGLDAFQEASNIFEIGFPLLLALKRILDGDEPSIDTIIRMRLSTIISELTNTEKNENSAYFDLMVNQYDASLRNALAHGDIVIDSVDTEIKIPSREKNITYEKFHDIATRNNSSAIFLTEVFLGTLKHMFIFDQDAMELFREDLGE